MWLIDTYSSRLRCVFAPVHICCTYKQLSCKILPFSVSAAILLRDSRVQGQRGRVDQGSDGLILLRTTRLQRVQDATARLLCDASPQSHASPRRKRLHWLPVSSRMQFRLCILMFGIQHGIASQYLAELCDRCDDTRLCSPSGKKLKTHFLKLSY